MNISTSLNTSKITTILSVGLLTFGLSLSTAFAQSPEKMSYQAVVRNSSDALVSNQAIGMQISILQGSITGTAVYEETQTPTTNDNGSLSIEVGNGTVILGTFNTINWANGPYFIKTEIDPTGGTTYTITGTNQLMSVPYALHAKTATSITGTITETDPVFGASVANAITVTDTANWNNHTIDTDTQLDSTDIANLGYVAGKHYLGEEFGGGVIYHLYIGSDGNQHGLIVNKNQSGGAWQASSTTTNATRSWDGAYNTTLMTGSAAATYVNGLTDGGFTDWYLPSIDELRRLYANRDLINKALNVIGGTTLLGHASYWSSTENYTTHAFYFSFYAGHSGDTNKTTANIVRAIRVF